MFVLKYLVYTVIMYSLAIFGAAKILRKNECSKFDANFSLVRGNTKLLSGVIIKTKVKDITICINECVFEDSCQSINFRQSTGDCELLGATSFDESAQIMAEEGWTFYETDPEDQKVGEACQELSPCPQHYCEDICMDPGYNCTCHDGFVGEMCETNPGSIESNPGSSCDGIKKSYQSANLLALTNQYYIRDSSNDTRLTLCNMNYGGVTNSDPKKSCKDWKEYNPDAKSGIYKIELTIGEVEVYCDMITDSGGWTMITNISFTNPSQKDDYKYVNLMKSDLKDLKLASSGKLALKVSTLKALYKEINFKQMRFFCTKPSHSTFHIATKLSGGQDVINFLIGDINKNVAACGSYKVFSDDKSTISKDCENWGRPIGSWFERNTMNKNNEKRLYDHLMFIYNKAHVNLDRYECDDYNVISGFSPEGTWQYYVR